MSQQSLKNNCYKPITPIIDYALAGSLLVLPTVLKMNKKAKIIYAIESMILLPYVALTKQPAAIIRIIPLQLHRKIAPFNVAQFALQTF